MERQFNHAEVENEKQPAKSQEKDRDDGLKLWGEATDFVIGLADELEIPDMQSPVIPPYSPNSEASEVIWADENDIGFRLEKELAAFGASALRRETQGKVVAGQDKTHNGQN